MGTYGGMAKNIMVSDTRTRKILSIVSVWLLMSVSGVLGAYAVLLVVVYSMDGSIDRMFLNNISSGGKSIVLLSLIIGAAIGGALGIKLWKILMKKTKLVSMEYVDKLYGTTKLKKREKLR